MILAKAPNEMEILQTPAHRGSVPEPTWRRATIFMAVVAFHICIIVLLVISRHAVQPKQKQGSLSVFALAAAPGPPAIQIPDPVIPVEAIATIWSPAEMGEIRHDGDRLVTKIDFSGRAEIALDTEASVRLIKGRRFGS